MDSKIVTKVTPPVAIVVTVGIVSSIDTFFPLAGLLAVALMVLAQKKS